MAANWFISNFKQLCQHHIFNGHVSISLTSYVFVDFLVSCTIFSFSCRMICVVSLKKQQLGIVLVDELMTVAEVFKQFA